MPQAIVKPISEICGEYVADLCGGSGFVSTLDSLAFLHENVYTARFYRVNHVTHEVYVCQFCRMDLMARICQLLLTHFLNSDTEVLQQPGALAS